MWQKNELSLAETFGVTDPRRRLDEIRLALGGDDYTPASRWGLSSLGIFHPTLSVKTWLGWKPDDGLVPITSLFNRTQTPLSDGWSVRKTQVLDFRGGTSTYDSHNGTDFAIPPATVVVASAPGVVRRISDEFHRGGLKVIIDHGSGVITTSNHLGRALVEVGDRVSRGEPIALSAYSGIDAVVAFPWSVPHVHFNTWVGGVPNDPFATDDEESMWRVRNAPTPYSSAGEQAVAEQAQVTDSFEPTEWDLDALDLLVSGCVDPAMRRTLEQIDDDATRAVNAVFLSNYFPTRFERRISPYAKSFERTPLLDLPFEAKSFCGIRFVAQ